MPFFNEEKSIIDSLRELDKISIANEIILIDDGSTDSSLKLVQNFIFGKEKYKNTSRNLRPGKYNIRISFSNDYAESDYLTISTVIPDYINVSK